MYYGLSRVYRALQSFKPWVKKSSATPLSLKATHSALCCSGNLFVFLSLSNTHTYTCTNTKHDGPIHQRNGHSDSTLEHYDTLGWAKSLTDWLTDCLDLCASTGLAADSICCCAFTIRHSYWAVTAKTLKLKGAVHYILNELWIICARVNVARCFLSCLTCCFFKPP